MELGVSSPPVAADAIGDVSASLPQAEVLSIILGHFLQHLAIADDMVYRRAQVVPDTGNLPASIFGPVTCSRCCHAPEFFPSRASIFSRRRGKSTGLVSYSSQPASMAFSRSPETACAVRAKWG